MSNIVKTDPFRTLFSFPRWVEDLDEATAHRGLKVRETENEIVAEAVVAGVPAKNVEVHIEDGVLTIKAQATDEEKEKGEYRSSSYQYYYTAALSGGQWDKADAEIEDGVVVVTIPKTPSSRPRKLNVKVKKAA